MPSNGAAVLTTFRRPYKCADVSTKCSTIGVTIRTAIFTSIDAAKRITNRFT